MKDKEIELLIEKKVAEAKFEVSETRLKFVLWIAGAMLVFFGAFVPIWQTNKASDKLDTAVSLMKQDIKSISQDIRTDSRTSAETLDKAMLAIREDVRSDIDQQSRQIDSGTIKVDNAIHGMKEQFKELAGGQLKKPILECRSGGINLESNSLVFSKSVDKIPIEIKNSGDAPAQKIRVRIYHDSDNDCFPLNVMNMWNSSPVRDEPNFACVGEANPFYQETLDPKESRMFDIYKSHLNLRPGKYLSILKVFYGQSEPRKYTFTIVINDDK